MRLERRLEGRNQDLKLFESEAGQIQELRGARLHIDKPQTGHKGYLLLWEVQYTTNRDKLIRLGAGILGALAAALCPIKSQIGGALQRQRTGDDPAGVAFRRHVERG